MPYINTLKGNTVQSPGPLRQQGFTLVELMVSIVVAAILIGIAIPSFDTVFNSNRLTSQTNQLVAALQIARGEAVRHNTRAIVCRSDDLATCTDGGSWNGWIAGLDTTRAGTVNQVLQVGSVTSPVQVLSSTNVELSRVTFHPDGYAYKSDGTLLVAGIAICLPTTRPQQNVSAISIAAGSRISTKSLNGAGSCAAPSNTP